VSSKTDYRDKRVEEWRMQEWEEFVRDLWEEMSHERPDTCWISTSRFVWISTSRSVSEDGTGLEPETWVAHFDHGLVYDKWRVLLEIHCINGGRYFLAFASLYAFSLKGKTREQFVTRLKQIAQKKHGWDVVDDADEFVPEFMNTVVCRTKNQDCWLAKDAKGKLDMPATVENFLKAVEILRDAVR